VSTTEIVGRMLIMTKEHHSKENAVLGLQSKFLTTSRMLRSFSSFNSSDSSASIDKNKKVIYIDGSWDMFHCGHMSMLEEVKKRGDFLIVGVHNDAAVNKRLGSILPLMNMHERVLSVLGCRHIDDVLIDAPSKVTQEMISSLNISEVVCGSDINSKREPIDERFRVPREAGIFTVIKSPSNFNMQEVLKRIRENQDKFESKIEKKKLKEQAFYDGKYGKQNGM